MLKKIIITLLMVVLIGIVLLIIYFRFISYPRDKTGMVERGSIENRSADTKEDTMEAMVTIQAVNTGTDEFGEEVGFGEADPISYRIKEGDCFYEGFDELLQNISEDPEGFSYDEYMKIKRLDQNAVTLEIDGEELEVEYDSTIELSSRFMVMDGASTYYRIKFEKAAAE